MAEATSEPGIDLLPDAIADAFWMVAHGFFAPSAERLRIDTTPPPTPPTPPPVLPPPAPGATKPPLPMSPPIPAPSSVPEAAPEAGQITLPTGHEQMKPGGEEPAGLPLRVPAGRALPGALELARALRPLMRRVPARTQLVLDEDETVRRVAEEGLWLPAMNPAPTRWLEVAVVVDANPSMRVWRETTRELRLLLERVGAFRDVRLWSLKSTPATPATPATMTLHAPGRKAVRAPAELLDPAGRRIILIVTDTMGEVWRDGTARRFMDGWCRRGCVALLHLLPQPLWRRTALKPARQIRVTTAEAGAPNVRLRALPLRPQALLWEAPDGVPIPVLPLEPAFVNAWAQLLTGSSRVRPLAVVFAPSDTPSESQRQGKTLSAVERVESFRNSNAGSPLVLQLASLFAAAPLRLPIMRLVQQALLPQSRQVHFAEVFLGGLMRRVSPAQEDEDPDEVAYEFFDGVRDLLRNSSPIGDSIEVVKTVSRYIEGRFGSSFDFEAMLADPDTAQPMASGGVPEIFATISAEVLRGLGGAHARAADRLLKRMIPPPLPNPLSDARRSLLNTLLRRIASPLPNPLHDARASFLTMLQQRIAFAPHSQVSREEPSPPPDRPFEGISILWVDDYPSNNVVQNAQLVSEGATVIEAISTGEALELVAERKFDAVISDLGRGEEQFAGFDLLKELRGRGLTMPFAIYASQRARRHRAEAVELGATVSTSDFAEVHAAFLKSLRRGETTGDDQRFSPSPLPAPLREARTSLVNTLLQRIASLPLPEVISPEPPPQKGQFDGVSILWVDDYPSNNTVEAGQLVREGATVTEAESTAEALELLGQEFDAIISDLGRGDEEFAGFDLLREVRRRGLTMPFVIYASQRARHHRAEALELGATASTSSFSEVRAALLDGLAGERKPMVVPRSNSRAATGAIIERTLKPNSVENLAQRLNQVETSGLTEGDNQIRVRVVGLIAGTRPDGNPENLVELEETTEPGTGSILIVTDLPEEESGSTRWFTRLQSQGLDPITYGNIFVLDEAGQPKEILAVTCRQDEKPVAPAVPALAAPTDKLISDETVKLIMESEGLDQPSRWPGAGAGITLGVGYDLGLVNEKEFRRDWGAHLPKEHIDRLISALGKTGGSARAIASNFKDIKIPREAARAVFKAATIPKFRAQALRAFPGMENLPPNAQGALISLVFSYGSAVEGERRREMRNIRNLIANFAIGLPTKPLQDKIAEQILAMKRLWRGTGLEGLFRRRDEEAKLVRMA